MGGFGDRSLVQIIWDEVSPGDVRLLKSDCAVNHPGEVAAPETVTPEIEASSPGKAEPLLA